MASDLITYIGAVCGGVGAIISVISYRRISALKSLDLRIETHRIQNDTHVALENLKELKERAIKSRTAVASATSMYRSGAMLKWQDQWQKDERRIEELSSTVPGTDVKYDDLNPKELEAIIVELDRARVWIGHLTKRYESDLQSDENQRNQLREDGRVHPPDRSSSFSTE